MPLTRGSGVYCQDRATKTTKHSTSWCTSPFLDSHSCFTGHMYHTSEHQSHEPHVDQSSTKDQHRTSLWPGNARSVGDSSAPTVWFLPWGFSFYTVLLTVYAPALLLHSCLNDYFFPMLISIAANSFTSHIAQGKPVVATMVLISFCLLSKCRKNEMLPL